MITDTMISRDIDATYSGTILGLRVNGKIEPVRVDGSPEDDVMFVIDANGDRLSLDLHDPRIYTEYPDSGVYNVGAEALFVKRRAQRQWRRGISRNHLEIGRSWSTVNEYELARAMYNPAYYTKDEALQLVSGDSESCAMSRNFWLCNDDRYKNTIVKFRDRIIGEVLDGDITIPDSTMLTLFNQEVI